MLVLGDKVKHASGRGPAWIVVDQAGPVIMNAEARKLIVENPEDWVKIGRLAAVLEPGI